MVDTPRKGAARVADVPPAILAQLEAGEIEAATLSENLATDIAKLMGAVLPALKVKAHQIDPKAGVTKRMVAAAQIIFDQSGMQQRPWLASHRSDLVRGWGAYLVAMDTGRPLSDRIEAMRPFADDPHFGVREWAWLALRPALAKQPEIAIAALTPFTSETSEYLRRFASEAIRPRGVWASHIKLLKDEPKLGLPVIEPLMGDPSRYVQNSVANWLNDAWKSQPDWVEEHCDGWLRRNDEESTHYIVKRGLRNRT